MPLLDCKDEIIVLPPSFEDDIVTLLPNTEDKDLTLPLGFKDVTPSAESLIMPWPESMPLPYLCPTPNPYLGQKPMGHYPASGPSPEALVHLFVALVGVPGVTSSSGGGGGLL